MSGSPTKPFFNNSTVPTLRGAFSCLLFFLLFFLFCTAGVVGQNEVNITSPEQNPTSANPIPIHIHFEGGVDELDTPDFYVTNGVMENLLRQDPNFIYGGSALGL